MTAFDARWLTRRRWRQGLLTAAGVLAAGAACVGVAQSPVATVQWKAALLPAADKHGLVVQVSGDVQSGWHVYGLKQAPNGPTPLKLTLDENSAVQTAGPVSGSAAEHQFDPSFGSTTEFYSGTFILYLPVRMAQPVDGAASHLIPISVRFQTCNGQVCVPPKTIHLQVPVEARRG